MSVNLWSLIAATNATADPSINFREGQAPSTVNNSARAMMAAIAKWRDDISGNIETGGSSTAYTVTTNQSLTPLVDGYRVVARMHATNGATPTLNVDGAGAKAINVYDATALPTGAVNEGSVHSFTYDSGDDCWYIGDFFTTTTLALTGLLLHAATELTAVATDDDLAIYDASTSTNKRITLANFGGTFLATESQAACVEMATDAEVRAATAGAKAVMAEDLQTAAAAVALTDSSTIAVNWASGINFTVTLEGNRTLGNPSNGIPGTWRRIQITQDGSGSRTLAYGGQYVFSGGSEPVLTTTASAVDVLYIYCRTASIFEVYVGGYAWAA
jgi:hypothetical protein